MKCNRAHELISAYLDGVIGVGERNALDEHLAGCAPCRQELESTRSVLSLLADAPRRCLSDDFDRKLNARLAQLGPRRLPWAAWERLWQMNAWRLRPALVPVALFLVAMTAFELWPRQPELPPSDSSVYVARLMREHESGTRWRELPEAAVDFNLQVSSAATVAGDLIQ
jgi:anti-sigma factor RsiW